MEITLLLLGLNLLFIIIIAIKLFSPSEDKERLERLLRDELTQNRQELTGNLKSSTDSLSRQIIDMTRMNENKLEKVREVVGEQLRLLQEDNSAKLEKMRETVDEKLHSTLEKRLNDSFQVVSERLEKVHEGLGEMQNLAVGVGDLKKVLTNVKTRGTWGEIALENLLEQILTPDQYVKNIATKKNSADRVEFAIKLPGREDVDIYLPIDSKFPKEDYEKLLKAQDEADQKLVEESLKKIEANIKMEAKKIQDKYIDPPHTTDFAIMFLPIEGLYAEVLRRPGLCDVIQQKHRINLAGPTTFAALLNSLRMGFRTLAVEKRTSEVRSLLGDIKKEFGVFGDILANTQKKLRSASNEIESASRKSRTIERKLRKVEELPVHQETSLLNSNDLEALADESSPNETAV